MYHKSFYAKLIICNIFNQLKRILLKALIPQLVLPFNQASFSLVLPSEICFDNNSNTTLLFGS